MVSGPAEKVRPSPPCAASEQVAHKERAAAVPSNGLTRLLWILSGPWSITMVPSSQGDALRQCPLARCWK